ncbi:fumarylacetoacetate hydrolase family protein [Acidocella sp.]|uniref:fumarylacetoacetate hydrolase family protein n=1 Tax=Acidocella sp. TaxID=50710 RepID=UPI0026064A14|nr:fumarylacetoacetate hydrolase family protein [Acidocella sp.]
MSSYVFAPPVPVAVAVRGGGLFAVRRVFCVGRNYAGHAREMGGDPSREPPFFFSKPADALVLDGAAMAYPPATGNLHHEVELVVAIGQGGAEIAEETALAHVFGYAVGLDMTRRDVQDEAKAARRPWDMAKGFDASAPIGEIAPASEIGHPAAGEIGLEVNGAARQRGDLADQTWPVAGIIAALSRLVTLKAGDLIFTGTPEGVGPVVPGDELVGRIAGVGEVRTRII